MATTPHPDQPTTHRSLPPAEQTGPVEEVWETVRPVNPASRFQTAPLAPRPTLARHLNTCATPSRPRFEGDPS
jgi:hypothetical protein